MFPEEKEGGRLEIGRCAILVVTSFECWGGGPVDNKTVKQPLGWLSLSPPPSQNKTSEGAMAKQ